MVTNEASEIKSLRGQIPRTKAEMPKIECIHHDDFSHHFPAPTFRAFPAAPGLQPFSDMAVSGVWAIV